VDKTPEKALSVGVETVTDAKEVLLVINGHNKAAALAATVEGPVSAKVTCSALQMHKNAIIACDEPACGELKVDTYKYFLDIEKSQRL
jgi:glucosamine-6-phosphate deaminase